MLLHWMHTRWMTVLTTAPGCGGLLSLAGCESLFFSGVVSADMARF